MQATALKIYLKWKEERWCMPSTKAGHFQLFWNDQQQVKKWLDICWGMIVSDNVCSLSTFLLLLEKQNLKNPCSFLYRLEHAKFVFNLKYHIVLCRIFRGFPFQNVDPTWERGVAIYERCLTAFSPLNGVRAIHTSPEISNQLEVISRIYIS